MKSKIPDAFCPDCGKKVNKYRPNRCKSCAIKERHKANPLFGDKEQIIRKGIETKRRKLELRTDIEQPRKGRKQQHYCQDCRKEICSRAIRCHACAGIQRRGVPFSAEAKKHQSEARKKAWERGLYKKDTEETRRRRTAARKRDWARGVFDNSEIKKKWSESRKRAWEEGLYDDAFLSPTSIEVEMEEALDTIHLRYKFQYRPKSTSFIYDFYLPDGKILIETDGTYWHSLPKGKERDKEKDAFAKKHGYTLLRFPEKQIVKWGALKLLLESEPIIKLTK